MKIKAINTEMAELSALCKALAHPVRVQILQLLLESHCLCGDMVNVLPLAQSTVSEHLRILKEVGLIYDEAEGPRRRYCVNHQLLKRFKTLIAAL